MHIRVRHTHTHTHTTGTCVCMCLRLILLSDTFTRTSQLQPQTAGHRVPRGPQLCHHPLRAGGAVAIESVSAGQAAVGTDYRKREITELKLTSLVF